MTSSGLVGNGEGAVGVKDISARAPSTGPPALEFIPSEQTLSTSTVKHAEECQQAISPKCGVTPSACHARPISLRQSRAQSVKEVFVLPDKRGWGGAV